ncbi:MAG: hypothetical protein ACRDBP_11600 [Luteolibacter sp.]
MKNVSLASLILILSTAMNLHAAIWTVDNNTSRPAAFRTIQAAIDAAAVGDTLMIAGSSVRYDGFSLKKRLNIKGPGNTLSGGFVEVGSNPNGNVPVLLSSEPDPLVPGNVRHAGGTLIEGIFFERSLVVASPCSFVTLKRCEFANNVITNYSLDSGAPNTMVIGCWMQTGLNLGGANSTAVGCRMASLRVNADQILVDNCTIGVNNAAGSPITVPFSPTLRNTILISSSQVNPGIYSGATFDHCMAIGHLPLPTGSGNVSLGPSQYINVFTTISSVVLKPGGPASGTGKNGVDMGFYGGSTPYIDGRIPALPRITEILVPSVVPDSSGLTFEVKAEARD